MAVNVYDRQAVRGGRLDVGRLFAQTKQIYLDAKANAAEFDKPKLAVDAMFALVELLGNLINEIDKLRGDITKGEEGLKGFDADLSGLRRRYSNLYRPFFDGLAPIEEWTAEDWASYEEFLEGPILMWNLATCRERWGVAFSAPPCEGPDLLMALSLLHQTGAALEHQEMIIESLYGFADLTLRDIVDTYEGFARKAGQTLADGFGAISTGVKDFVTGGKTGRLLRGLGIAAAATVVAGGGYLLTTKLKKG